MKLNFEEPKIVVESFSVEDTLTVSWIPELGPDETNPFGGLNPISGN